MVIMPTISHRFAVFIAVFAVFLWAASQVASATIIEKIHPVNMIIIIEFMFICVGIVICLVRRLQFAQFLRLAIRQKQIMMLAGLCGFAILIYEVCFYIALSRDDKWLVIVVASLWPVFTIYWGRFLEVGSWVKVHFSEVVTILVACVGAALITGDRSGFDIDEVDFLLVCLSLIAAVSGGFWDASVGKIIDYFPGSWENKKGDGCTKFEDEEVFVDVPHVIFFSIILARLLLLPAYFTLLLFMNPGSLSATPGEVVIFVLFITLFGYVFADVIFSIALSWSGLPSIGALTYVVPLFATVLFFVFFGVQVSFVTIAGLYLVLIALFSLHANASSIEPSIAGLTFLLVTAGGALTVDKSSVEQFVASPEAYSTQLQLGLAALTVALGFLLQQAQARRVEEHRARRRLNRALVEFADERLCHPSDEVLAAITGFVKGDIDIYAAVAKLKTAGIQPSVTHAGDMGIFVRHANVCTRIDEWERSALEARKSQEYWFMGVLVYAVSFLIAIVSLGDFVSIALSSISGAVLMYLWISLVRVAED